MKIQMTITLDVPDDVTVLDFARLIHWVEIWARPVARMHIHGPVIMGAEVDRRIARHLRRDRDARRALINPFTNPLTAAAGLREALLLTTTTTV